MRGCERGGVIQLSFSPSELTPSVLLHSPPSFVPSRKFNSRLSLPPSAESCLCRSRRGGGRWAFVEHFKKKLCVERGPPGRWIGLTANLFLDLRPPPPFDGRSPPYNGRIEAFEQTIFHSVCGVVKGLWRIKQTLEASFFSLSIDIVFPRTALFLCRAPN